MRVVFDGQFQTDLKYVVRQQPYIQEELRELVAAVREFGEIPPGYNPHELTKARGTYTGYFGLHLQEGKFDVIVLYRRHRSEPIIRFVRIGSHRDIFQGRAV
ncbi:MULTISPECIES: type II toxin-antitoxin system mRNA interferase toxin, RelE/StbE family [Actinotignum]|uniref:Type II toxin-antitoxin system mRNA interferase toxin, RelE/StbE family n=1 Tax=Actinotignum timonense TaxID=1870995 RepID=A0AAW9HKH7_9ACTO|nr:MULTISPECIES: type II toxin-antitoxin system mRNA interferase toxin, RelE/StbE family [Actinotignum]MBS5748574.1 type II toxin-antitoxin system mRNA interferase toxin, RelE/StbE family [Actinotignum schaalii]MDE1559111.1 type II toxin-antitoxin system mRNA interferase toxin, RelE/StbE family [Actinotignum schaalii]MDE1663368.1 type II toxin-antitoxin system mRNA interferase toxin, RelE/StbE family [Actinotignum schaalii]MDK6373113.1 type II toxin-antitoxin system mRNA interferase toxin, RelE